MLKKIFQINKLHMITIISLLICSLFLTYFNSNYTVEVFKKSVENDNPISRFLNSETYTKTNGSNNKLRFSTNKLADTENEEIISEKAIADTHYDSHGKKWMVCYLNIFTILAISIYLLFVKGWFIKVSQSRFQFCQVHFIQLKDGKKGALSYCYSL